MSLDEQVASYINGWRVGVSNASGGTENPTEHWQEPAQRGYAAGRAAYFAAAQAESERLERHTAPNPDDEELRLLDQQEVAQAAGHYHRRTGVRLSLSHEILHEWNGTDKRKL